jgi:hypothetical protein
MSEFGNVRWGWLKFMYAYTIVGAGLTGAGMLLAPNVVASALGMPGQDPITFGITGSVYLAFGVLSIFGLRSPLKFVPVLLLQLCYKAVWLAGAVLPLLIRGQFPLYAVSLVVIFATYVIGDLIAIPFPYVFAKQSGE